MTEKEFCTWKYKNKPSFFESDKSTYRSDCEKEEHKHYSVKWEYCPFCGRELRFDYS